MKLEGSPRPFLLGAAAMLAGAMVLAGCNNHASHPDEKSAVSNSLDSNHLNNVSVSQDRDKGVMTLSGNVDSDDAKTQAETLAKQAAPDYTIANEVGVRPPQASNAGSVASNLDSAIEDNFKASIKAHRESERPEHQRLRQEWNARDQGLREDRGAEEGSCQARQGCSQRAAGRQ